MRQVGWIGYGGDPSSAATLAPIAGIMLRRFEDIAGAIVADVATIILSMPDAPGRCAGRDHRDICDLALATVAAALPVADGRPLLVAMSHSDPSCEIRLLQAGADGCLAPPHQPELIAARIEALLRRGREGDRVLICADLRIDLLSRAVTRGGRRIDLLPREFALLVHLARNGGAPVGRRSLLSAVWARDYDPGTNVVQVHVSRLRAKVDRGFGRPLIHNRKGIGYSLSPEAP